MNTHLKSGIAAAAGLAFAAAALPQAAFAAPLTMTSGAAMSVSSPLTQIRYRKVLRHHVVRHPHVVKRRIVRRHYRRHAYGVNPGAAVIGSILGLAASGAFGGDDDYPYYGYGYGPYGGYYPDYGYSYYPSYGYSYATPYPAYGGHVGYGHRGFGHHGFGHGGFPHVGVTHGGFGHGFARGGLAHVGHHMR